MAENRWMDDLANFLCRCQTWQETARREEDLVDRSMEMELTYIARRQAVASFAPTRRAFVGDAAHLLVLAILFTAALDQSV